MMICTVPMVLTASEKSLGWKKNTEQIQEGQVNFFADMFKENPFAIPCKPSKLQQLALNRMRRRPIGQISMWNRIVQLGINIYNEDDESIHAPSSELSHTVIYANLLASLNKLPRKLRRHIINFVLPSPALFLRQAQTLTAKVDECGRPLQVVAIDDNSNILYGTKKIRMYRGAYFGDMNATSVIVRGADQQAYWVCGNKKVSIPYSDIFTHVHARLDPLSNRVISLVF